MTTYIRWFRDIGLADIGLVGGKTASLGELYGQLGAAGVRVPDGFAVTAEAYRALLDAGGLRERIAGILDRVRVVRFLVDKGITSISLNPDAVVRGLEAVAAAEARAGAEDAA